MRVLSIANFKGGTGKTVTACNLAAILAAEHGKRVLLIDADPQHNTTDFYLPAGADGEPSGAPSPTLTDILEGTAEPVWVENVIPTGREGLDLIAADMGLLRLDLAALADGDGQARRRMADFLDTLREDDAFDFVIFDCPPSFTAASVAALTESDDVILPTRVDAFSRAGVTELIDQLRGLGRSTRANFLLLVTMANRSNLSRQGSGALRASGLWVFPTEIRDCVKVGESTYAREPLIEYAPKCSAAQDYRAVAGEYVAEWVKGGG